MSIRPLTEADLPEVQAIYAHHVQHGTGTWEWDPPDLAEMQRRAVLIQEARLPYLIAEIQGAVAGYAYAGPFRPRRGYCYTLEDSVYVHPDFVKQGIGHQLLHALIEQCRALGYRQLVAVIGDSANAPSIALHRKHGFEACGLLPGVGFKFGRFLDSVYMQLSLQTEE